jgi:hypothetical protein
LGPGRPRRPGGGNEAATDEAGCEHGEEVHLERQIAELRRGVRVGVRARVRARVRVSVRC